MQSIEAVDASRQRWIAAQKKAGVDGMYRTRIHYLPLPPPMADALRVPRAGRAVVVELGEIDPRSAAGLAACKRLEEAGATAFSMTVRERESESDYERVLALAQQTTLPVVVRDRVIDRYLVTMARAHGAAAVTVQPSVLGDRELQAVLGAAVEHGLEVWFELETTVDLERAVRFGQGHPVGPGFRTASVGASKEGGTLPMVETTRRLISRLPDAVLRLWTMDEVPEVLPSTSFSQDFDAWVLLTPTGQEVALAALLDLPEAGRGR